MSTLDVGPGAQYSTIATAVAAANSGDTIDVQAGTYSNDFLNVYKSLTLQAVGGTVSLVATQDPPNGKGIIDEGGSGVNVTIQGFDISGSHVSDGNGAGVRYEGGTLTLNNDTIHGNQDGVLSNADPSGSITVSGSNIYGNGDGGGSTHDVYIGDVNSLTVQNSTISAADVGHEIKSRAQNTTITGDTIEDGPNGTSSYEIDLPNGGNATITGNVIEKGPNAQNPHAISFGEEGGVYSSSSLNVSGNTMINNDPSQSSTGVQNDTGVTASVTNNQVFGWNTLVSGPANASSNTTLTAAPALSSLSPDIASGTAAATVTSADTSTPAASDTAAATGTADTSGTTATSTDTSSAPITADTIGSSTSAPSFTSGDAGGSAQATGSSTPVASASASTSAANANGDQLASAVTQAQTTPPAVGTTPTHSYPAYSLGSVPGWNHTPGQDSPAWHSICINHGDGG